MNDAPNLKVAIVCDWLLGIGGAERVVLELHKMFPDAPIYTSQYNPKKINLFDNADVRTTWLQKLPSGLKKFLPVLRAWTFSHLDLSDYDFVISATGAEAKSVRTGSKTVHLCYCFAPTHYYWSRYDQYIDSPGFGAFNWLARLGLRTLVGPMRRWDKKAAQRPDHLIGISTYIQNEIKKYYGRDAGLIHPPVNIERFQSSKAKPQNLRHGFVVTGRQVSYKRIDLAIAACTRLSLPLTVIGDGPEHANLVKLAGPTVKFLTDTSDSDVVEYFHTSEAFIFPGLDDFGIVAVEGMAAGMPVIAYKGGGALDYIVPTKTGEFFDKQNVESLVSSLKKFKSDKFSESRIRGEAELFDASHFHQAMQGYIRKTLFAKKQQ
ncbi:MAG TPA: glycosyltransferase [Patescibacteria group bacterium]|nr:glycosyltransferase [Patescibacteria group bacterium]